MEKKVIAVIGCGRIATNAHFPAFAEMDNIRVKYACDLIIEKANALKNAIGKGINKGIDAMKQKKEAKKEAKENGEAAKTK
jgi:predicted dehydrogenase